MLRTTIDPDLHPLKLPHHPAAATPLTSNLLIPAATNFLFPICALTLGREPVFDANVLNWRHAGSFPREVLLPQIRPIGCATAARAFLLRPHTIGGLPRQQTSIMLPATSEF